MRTKKVLQMTALAALATAAWVGAGSVDASAAVTVSYDTTNAQLEVTGDSKQVMVGVATYNKSKKTLKVADTAWDVYDFGTTKSTVDLSKISNTKDVYIAVRSDKTATPAYYKLGASISKQKVKYDVTKHTATIEPTTSDLTKGATFEYRTPYGTWKDISTSEKAATTFEAYEPQGATLYVRAKAGAPSSTTQEDAKDISKNKDGEDVKVTVLGYLPGKEAKLNIAKQANGPKVTLDYTKGTVKLPKDAEYRTLLSSDGTSYDAASTVAPGATDATDVSTYLNSKKAAVLEVRKKATDKKVASKWTIVNLAEPTKVLDTEVTATIAPDGSDIEKVAKITYDKDAKGKYSTKKSITMENKYDGDINVIIGDKATAPKASDKITKTIKKGGKASIKVESGKMVYVRSAGVKSTSTWAGAYTKVGEIAIPADPTPVPTEAPKN